MTARSEVRPLTSIGLVVASLFLFLAGAGIAAFAFVGAPGGEIRVDAADVVAILLGAWLALAGVEILRRRHFAFSVLTPVVLALLNIGYTIASRRLEGLGGVVLMLIPVLLVAGSRPAFRD